jgi:hypothetical protein
MNLGEIFRSISNFLSVESLERFFTFVLPSLLLILTAYITFKLNDNANKRELVFQEKKEAYTGLLKAYAEIVRICNLAYRDSWGDMGRARDMLEERDDFIKSQSDFTYWRIRCRLVGSDKLNKYIKRFETTDPATEDQLEVEHELERLMTEDLKIK